MTPNQITAIRVLAAFASVMLFGRGTYANVAAVALTVTAIVLDAVDGYIARRLKLSTPLGAQFDILGDRIVENLYFTYFAVVGAISLWVPIFFFVRGSATDFLRGLAARAGRSGFGQNSMLETWWGRLLVASRGSRAAYGVLKCTCFCMLGLQLAVGGAWQPPVALVARVLVWATLVFCGVRGLPVLWEGRRYLAMNEPALKETAKPLRTKSPLHVPGPVNLRAEARPAR